MKTLSRRGVKPSIRFSKQLPLRLILIVPFVLQTVAAVGLTGWLSLRNGQRAVNDLATQLEIEVSDRIDLRLDSYLDTPHQINQINADAVELGLLSLQDFQNAGHYFWRQMQAFDVGYIYYVLSTGEYAGSGYFLDLSKATIDELSPNTQGRANTYATDDRGNRTNLVASYDDYDPQSEAAYTDAVQAGKPTWSQIYQWDNFPEIISVSASYPIYNDAKDLIGVLVTSLRLSQISDYLRQLKVSPSSKIFVVERNGLLVASSSTEQPYAIVNGEAERLKVENSTDPLIRATAESLREKFGNFSQINTSQSFTFNLDGEQEFVRVTPWRDQYGLDWLIVVTVPESDFTAQINANTRTTILLCLGALGVTIGLGIFTARWITKPILRLTQASEAIANGQLNQTTPVKGIKELSVLAQSFNRMAQQLQDSFAELAATNTQLEDRVEARTAELSQALVDLRRTQGQLIQTEKMSSLGQLVAGVAHEINNPVNFIHGNLAHTSECTQELLELVSLYQDQYPHPAPQVQKKIEAIDVDFLKADFPKLLKSMQVGADRIREIIKSLRNFSRLDEAEFKQVDIHEGIDSTLMILHSRLKTTPDHPGIQIIKDYGQLPLIECYPGQLNQVFMNLLSNAIDALDEYNKQRTVEEIAAKPSMIRITTEAHNRDWVKICIADNGLGIREEISSKLFDPFFTTKPVGKGTGLGLSISYQVVVEKHCGKMQYHSTPGQGAEFVIQIPIQQGK